MRCEQVFVCNFLIPVLVLTHGCYCNSKSTIYIGKPHNLSVQVPIEYRVGFTARAFVMWCDQITPDFKAALSVEAVDGRYSCSLEVFLGDVKVWSSGHYSRFYTSERCVLELSEGGDLQLKGQNELVGWKTGTSGQGVERLQILGTGNLVLLDGQNRIKWQSFNFPTDVMLRGQRLNVATSLTSFHTNTSSFYSFEIHRDRVALYLNSGKWRYSYWEFKPSNNRNITFLQLGSNGLKLFSDQYKKIAQIPSQNVPPLQFLALGKQKEDRGNLGLYFYSPEKKNFEVSFQALNATCDLPLACKPYGICTFTNTCSCIRFRDKEVNSNSNPDVLCGKGKAEMMELEGVGSVLRASVKSTNVSKEECSGLCVDDCSCAAALYVSGGSRECWFYGLVVGVRQLRGGSGVSYMVKVAKGSNGSHGKADVKKWVLVLVVVGDGLVILVVLGGFGYYLFRKRKRNLLATNNTTLDDT